MLKVGKYENIQFSAQKNDKGSLVVTAKVAGEENFDLDEATTENKGEESQGFLFYPFKTEGYENNNLVTKRSNPLIIGDIRDLKAVLTAILQLVMPAEDIVWDLYQGTEVTLDNAKTTLFNDVALGLVYNNLADQFINQLNSSAGKDDLFRVVFVRTSGPKHYPKFRSKELDVYPFAEPMSVPAKDSKVVFTPYELKAKLDNPDPVQPNQSAADKQLPQDI